jgi:site-specific recombinase XerD
LTTFSEARDAYANRAEVHSAHTFKAYIRAIDLFLEYLGDRHFEPRLPIQQKLGAAAGDLLIAYLAAEDEPILKTFAIWLETPGGDKRPYAVSTIELRLAGILRWFEFMGSQGWLPADFSLDQAKSLLKMHLVSLQRPSSKSTKKTADLADLVNYYANQKPSRRLSQNSAGFHRWELTRLRNHALLQTLAETGGQVSAILGLNIADIKLDRQSIIIPIMGKGSHTYQITLGASLPSVKAYLTARGLPPDDNLPLFVSHDARHEGQRMSRFIAWRIVQRAARAVGLPRVSPHDLRHWRAQQLILTGASPEEVQQRLGHRSLHTIHTYYGQLFEERDRQRN